MSFGICEHAGGVLIEQVPAGIGYTLDELLEAIRCMGPVTWQGELA